MTLARWTCPECGKTVETLASARWVVCVRRKYHARGERAVEMVVEGGT